jgi:predicted DsbA family dithiol-disulfide isomerase
MFIAKVRFRMASASRESVFGVQTDTARRIHRSGDIRGPVDHGARGHGRATFGPMDVEIWSDIACPWCAVGKRRFEAALARFEHRDEVVVTWRSFELEPDAPQELGHDLATHLAAKYGTTRERAEQMQAQMTGVAAAEGLTFRFDRARSGSTFDAHRLVHLAAAHGRQDAMTERLMRAYLGEGELVSDHETLARLAADVGLPGDEVRDALAGGRFADAVRDDERTAAALGIHAVPCFVVDRRVAVSGAQPPEVLLELLARARAAAEPVVPVVAGGERRDVEGC